MDLHKKRDRQKVSLNVTVYSSKSKIKSEEEFLSNE
jgi:hypothetical protein